MKIIFSGGGTLGSVTPLLAMKEDIQKVHKNAKFVWIGTKNGPEKDLIKEYGIPFYAISSGKLRRYFSLMNFVDIFKVFIGFFQSFAILWKEKPTLCVTAGGFVSVPVHLVAWIFNVSTWVHQQDVVVGLSNKIMAVFATKITTALENSITLFPAKKVEWLGNPVRQEILEGSKEKAIKEFGLLHNLPVVFVMGGGTGSVKINQLVMEALPHLKNVAQIIHVTGQSQDRKEVSKDFNHKNYFQFEFFKDEIKDAYAIADVVVSRGGFGTLTELAALQKPSIIIPKTGHQEYNVKALASESALISLNENMLNGVKLANKIKELLESRIKSREMGHRLSQLLPIAKSENIIDIVEDLGEK
jgi:UDP-N-acetylglucosamine--N-acetylmuramyl-(pentapeptide) pyrophosphoryl-undecaprenol N-acetylglucosamine transferase